MTPGSKTFKAADHYTITLLFPSLIFGMLFASSCKVVSPKTYENLLFQQDSLQKGWKASQLRTMNLEDEVARLKSDTASVGRRLRVAQRNLSSSSSQAKQLASDLAEREARLQEVEEILDAREASNKQLRDQLQQALLGFQDKGLSVNMHDGKVYVSLTDKLLFPSGSIVIDERGKMALSELAKVLNDQPEINIAVEGHTDNQRVVNLGQIKDNWDLSVLRATSVVRYLTNDRQINPERLTASGSGEFKPVDSTQSGEARSMNRRIEIVLSPKLDELYQLIR